MAAEVHHEELASSGEVASSMGVTRQTPRLYRAVTVRERLFGTSAKGC
jgi:hypothetical protein